MAKCLLSQKMLWKPGVFEQVWASQISFRTWICDWATLLLHWTIKAIARYWQLLLKLYSNFKMLNTSEKLFQNLRMRMDGNTKSCQLSDYWLLPHCFQCLINILLEINILHVTVLYPNGLVATEITYLKNALTKIQLLKTHLLSLQIIWRRLWDRWSLISLWNWRQVKLVISDLSAKRNGERVINICQTG